jgi:hypothetical protein
MHANLVGVFNERVYADDIRWTDDDRVTTGRDADHAP